MNRILLFLCGCIIIRSLFVYLAYWLTYAHPSLLPWMAVPALVISISFFTLFLFHLRQTGREVNDERIWWDPIRPIHGGLYLAFVVLVFRKHRLAYLPLLIDVLFGLVMFTGFHVFGWLHTD